jgi:hypothetical protein
MASANTASDPLSRPIASFSRLMATFTARATKSTRFTAARVSPGLTPLLLATPMAIGSLALGNPATPTGYGVWAGLGRSAREGRFPSSSHR